MGEKGKIASGAASGNVLTLKLAAPAAARNITYLDSKSWSEKQSPVRREMASPPLTFCQVPLSPAKPNR